MIGKSIAHYKVLEKIGEGGMGVVYKAEDTKLKRAVALKFLPSELTRDAQAKARFVQEAQAAAALDHPNICAVHEIGEAEGATYIVMPYIKGQSLKERIATGHLSVEEALAIAGQVAEGLKEAHERGIIHRDIKPANIMLTEKGQAKIMDFGLAKLEAGVDLTRTMAVMGTAAYMSPEQARGEEVDHRTDIWSFGATLYEMLTGQKPFGKKHDQALIYSILNDATESVSRIRPEIPRPLDGVVQKAMEKDKARRYQNMAEILDDLKVASAIEENILGLKDLRKSIAVLPFQDMSPKKDQEYFCDGMAEEIINALTHIENLKVIARTSAFVFKEKYEDIREIGRKLGVETLLEGSIRTAGNRLRITAQLIRVDDGSHLWSDRYDRELKDVFAIQDEIAMAIVENLKIMLLGREKKAILKRHTDDLEAYVLYLKGRQSRQRKDLEGFNHALEYLENSIKLDQKYSLAYAEMAFTYVLMAWFCCLLINNELKNKILYYANKALELDLNTSDAYIALALAWELFDHDQVKAEKFAGQAVNLNPGNSEAIQEHGFILGRMGNFEAAIRKMESTISLDPLSVLAHNGLAYTYYYQGDFQSALKQTRMILAVDPTFFPARFLTSLSLTELKDYSRALLELEKCLPSNLSVIAHRGYIYGKMDRRAEANHILDEIKDKHSEDPLSEFLMALVYAGMDDDDNAFVWFQRSQDKYGFVYRERTLGADFRIAKFRTDPKFGKLTFY